MNCSFFKVGMLLFYSLNFGFCTGESFQDSISSTTMPFQENIDTQMLIKRVEDLRQNLTNFSIDSCLFLKENFLKFTVKTFESLMELELSFFKSLSCQESYPDSSFLKTLLGCIKDHYCAIDPNSSKVKDLINRLFEVFTSSSYVFEKQWKGYDKPYTCFSSQEFLLQILEGPWLLEESLLESFGHQLFKYKKQEEKDGMSFYSLAFWNILEESSTKAYFEERPSNFQTFYDLFSNLYFENED